MTLHQEFAGKGADYGSIGFEKGAAGQVLVFPKSLKSFEGKKIVGVKYELLVSSPAPKPEREEGPKPLPSKRSHKKKKPTKPPCTTTQKSDAGDVNSGKADTKVVHFPAPPPDRGDQSGEIKVIVRQALQALEAGKQVTAYNLLKQILDT